MPRLWVRKTPVNGMTMVPRRFTTVPPHSAQNGRGSPPTMDRTKEGFSAVVLDTLDSVRGRMPRRERFRPH
ncbi:hypothetical protein GCM10020001_079740 [Nonomuraea salmonea]